MSCIMDLKIVALIKDEGDDYICNHLNELKSSFFKKMIKNTSAGIKLKVRKSLLKGLSDFRIL